MGRALSCFYLGVLGKWDLWTQTHSLKLNWDNGVSGGRAGDSFVSRSHWNAKILSRRSVTSFQQCSTNHEKFTLNSADTILILHRFTWGGVSFVFFMCLAVPFSRELDLCVLNIKLFLDRLYMTTENCLMCSVSSSRLDEWKAVGVHAEIKMYFLPLSIALSPGLLYLQIVPWLPRMKMSRLSYGYIFRYSSQKESASSVWAFFFLGKPYNKDCGWHRLMWPKKKKRQSLGM